MKTVQLTLGYLASGFALLLVLLTATLVAAAIRSQARDAMVTGTVASLEHRGLLFQTWEGTLTDGFRFSVDSSSPRQDYVRFLLTESMRSGSPITLRYVRSITAGPWRGDTPTLVYDAIQHTPTHATEDAEPPPTL